VRAHDRDQLHVLRILNHLDHQVSTNIARSNNRRLHLAHVAHSSNEPGDAAPYAVQFHCKDITFRRRRQGHQAARMDAEHVLNRLVWQKN